MYQKYFTAYKNNTENATQSHFFRDCMLKYYLPSTNQVYLGFTI